MTAHDPTPEGMPDPTARHVPERTSAGAATGAAGDGGATPPGAERLRNPEAALGGADAVEKTSAVVGRGTDPQAMRGAGPAGADLPSGRGPNLLVWGVVAIAAVILLVYVLGILG